MFKKIIKSKLFWLALIILIAAFLRFYRISETTDFNYDQARSATFAREIITDHKPILIGPDSILGGKTIYHGPLHFYLIAPGLMLFNFNPVGADYVIATIGVMTIFVIYFLTRNLHSTLLYAVFPISVIYSRWAWSPNPQPFFSALSLLFLNKKRYFLAGVFCGLTIQLHILAAVMFAVLVLILFFKRELKKGILYLIVGTIVGYSPVLIFNLRHSFIGLAPLLEIFSSGQSSRGINIHYFLWILPFLALISTKLPKKILSILIIISFVTSLYLIQTSNSLPSRLPSVIYSASQIIISDQQKNGGTFNVASFVDPDTRATPYRYFLTLNGVYPLGIDKYSIADHLYVLSNETSNDLLKNTTYEIDSFHPTHAVLLGSIGAQKIYKLYNK